MESMPLCIWIGVLMAATAGGASPAPNLSARWVDDQGGEIAGLLELCEQVATEQDCRQVDAGAFATIQPQVTVLRVEGPRHGPATFAQVPESSDEPWTVVVSRKARLTTLSAADISIYDAEGNFRRPTSKHRLSADEAVWIPTGPSVVSARVVSTADKASLAAPDLRWIDPEPAEEIEIRPEARAGWSAALRLQDSSQRGIDNDGEFSIEQPFGYAAMTGRPPGSKILQVDKFAFLLGISDPIVQVDVQVDGFLPSIVPALSATPGSFAFFDLTLNRGGALSFLSSLAGEPVVGGKCRVVRYAIDPMASASDPTEVQDATILASAITNRLGQCKFERLAPGAAVAQLEFESTDGAQIVEQAVHIADEETTEVELAIEPLTISGEITRGTEPAVDYRVSAMPVDHRLGTGRGQLRSKHSDSEGTYRLVLHQPGAYVLLLEDEYGTPSDHRRLRVERDEVIDWQLHAAGIDGRVVDSSGHSVADIVVRLSWRSGGNSSRLARTADDGSFHFSLQGDTGEATLQAGSARTGRSQVVDLLVDDSAPAEVILRLAPPSSVNGRLLLADGSPATLAWLQAERIGQATTSIDSFRAPRTLAVTTTDEAGHFELGVPPGVPARLFFGGHGCPLGLREVAASPPGQEIDSAELVVQCSGEPANLLVHLDDVSGAPVEHAGLILRRAGTPVPFDVIGRHLSALGLPSVTGGTGRLALVALEPTTYDVFLAGATSAYDLDAGRAEGFLRTVSLSPHATVELAVTLTSIP